jgi:hypothetical protein
MPFSAVMSCALTAGVAARSDVAARIATDEATRDKTLNAIVAAHCLLDLFSISFASRRRVR